MATEVEHALEFIERRVTKPVRVMISNGTGKQWVVGVHSGEEEPGNGMVAAAGYGLGASIAEALSNALSDFGLKPGGI